MPSVDPPPPFASHGSAELPAVSVESYNLEVRDKTGFVGDRARKGAFADIVAELRAKLAGSDADPFAGAEPGEPTRARLAEELFAGSSVAAGLAHVAIDRFADELVAVIRRFLRSKAWRDVERIVVGGGFRQGRIGEIVIGAAAMKLSVLEVPLSLVPIRNHPDEAGLIGSVHLAPPWIFSGYDSIVAIDIGGTNFRCGIVELRQDKAKDFSAARVWKSEVWRHAAERPSRGEATDRLVAMIDDLIARAERSKLKLAPFVGIGCPGVIAADGFIEKGAQNLPGDWESSRFHLAALIRERIPVIAEHDTVIMMHNDAVVQGLSEAPFMRDVARWGVLTIGTGLGNAVFQNRLDPDPAD